MKKTSIYVTFQKEGIHCYPAALTDPALQSVKFLGYEHRHIFHFKVKIDVLHNDRDIEFIMFKRWLEGLYVNNTLQLNHKSCEMIGEDLYVQINAMFPGRDVTIEVSEDGENGAILEWINEDDKEYNLSAFGEFFTTVETPNDKQADDKLNKLLETLKDSNKNISDANGTDPLLILGVDR